MTYFSQVLTEEERHDAQHYIDDLTDRVMAAITNLAHEDGTHHVYTPSATVALVRTLMDVARLEIAQNYKYHNREQAEGPIRRTQEIFTARIEGLRKRTDQYFSTAAATAERFGI
jgi:hypothetical protein